MDKFVLGLDFGTDSVRALIVNAITGEEAGTYVSLYKRWSEGAYCDASRNQYRQHPLDYLEGMEEVIKEVLAHVGRNVADKLVALSVDTTGSTPVAVDRKGMPLSLYPEFSENVNAMFVLWKDHTAVKEAAEINAMASSWSGVNYTKYEGGIYSSEWFWAKLLHIIRIDEKVRNAAYSWMEHCDWIPALLTGATDVSAIKRSRCAAGHKAMWHAEWGGLPDREFLTRLDPLLGGFSNRLYRETYTVDTSAGTISSEWADRLGLPKDLKIGVGALDAHMGAIGGEIKPYFMSKVMGTSTCDMVIVSPAEIGDTLVRGICGQVDGSILPGYIGLEAGQSAFGDVYAWFRDLLLWPLRNGLVKNKKHAEIRQFLIEDASDSVIEALSEAAFEIDPERSGLLAIDWLNGRRTPDANHLLKGCISGLSLGTSAPAIFRSLVEATAFGSKSIIDRFRKEGIRIDGVLALGGVTKKSPFVMQIVCDVLNIPIQVVRHEQTCALGAAMAAAVVASVHPDLQAAQRAMGSGIETEYLPRPEYVSKYADLYKKYCSMGDFIDSLK